MSSSPSFEISTTEIVGAARRPFASTSDHDENSLVPSLQSFLQTWTEASNPSSSPSSPAKEFLAQFPSPLPSRLPRSFRPCEMLPALYLGSWQDVGADVASLSHRIEQQTAALNSTSSSSPGAAQRVVLVVRACPLPGVSAPQLQLHVARARKSGGRQLSEPARGTSLLTRPSLTQRSAAADNTVESAVPVRDVEVLTLSLTEVHARVCAAVLSHEKVTSAQRKLLAAWLSPQTPSTSSIMSTDAVGACWQAYVRAAQDVLLSDYPEYCACVPPTWQEAHCYWRLVLPILDSPTVQIQRLFPMTTLLLHAALSLASHPTYETWIHNGAAGSAAADTSKSPDTTTAHSQGVAPCAVVHCQAGKSRSVSLVAAFVLQEWMLWHATTTARDAVDVPAKVSAASAQESRALRTQQSTMARRLVDAVMSHLRSRRLCVDVNLGFNAQLENMVKDFLLSL